MKCNAFKVDGMAVGNSDDREEKQLSNVVSEPLSIVNEPCVTYGKNVNAGSTYINPFDDWAFKRIFASEAHKEVIMAFLNEVLQGKRQIQDIAFSKNEYPGEIEEEGGSVFDFVCTDFDGTSFLVEVQKQKQKYFKERSLFYAGRLISDQAPKGDKNWKYNLKEVYSISLLEGFCLPATDADAYMHSVCLCDMATGQPFYDKLHFIYIEMLKFGKAEAELTSALDQWLYALKYASKMKKKPEFLNAPELTTFFDLANYAKLTPEERDMYRTAQQRKWDQQNVLDYAKEEGQAEGMAKGIAKGITKGRIEGEAVGMAKGRAKVAKSLKAKGIDLKIIAESTGLSIEEIMAL